MRFRQPVIYIATNLETGQQYVGQTVNFKHRMRSHACPSRTTYFDNALRKRGMAGFNFVVLNYAEDELNYWEKFWIAKLDTMWPNGYNHTSGGDNFKRSGESIRRGIASRPSKKGVPRPEWVRKAISAGKIAANYRPSDETKRKISETKKKNPTTLNNEQRTKLSQAVTEWWAKRKARGINPQS
jgi:group I intron endonuclease